MKFNEQNPVVVIVWPTTEQDLLMVILYTAIGGLMMALVAVGWQVGYSRGRLSEIKRHNTEIRRHNEFLAWLMVCAKHHVGAEIGPFPPIKPERPENEPKA